MHSLTARSMPSKRLAALLFALVLAALVVLIPTGTADARWKAKCVPHHGGPKCYWWNAKATFIADGDTIKVKVERSKRVRRVRFIGINANELHRYSKYANRRWGECHGLEATSLVERYVKRSHWRVRLAAQHPSSSSGGRLRRAVWVRSHGHWVDLSKIELNQALALFLPNGDEYAHNREYETIAEKQFNAKRGIFSPTGCGQGPDPLASLRLILNWDADGDDNHNVNDEWVDIYNDGLTDVNLSGWWLRDSYLRYDRGHKPYPNRPCFRGNRKPCTTQFPPPGYAFRPNAVVPAGGKLRVHVGRGTNNPKSSVFYWGLGTSVFENVTHKKTRLGDGAYLLDPNGNMRAGMMYPCLVSCSDPNQGKVKLIAHPKRPEFVAIQNISRIPLNLQDDIVKLQNHNRVDSYVFGYHLGSWASKLAPGQKICIFTTDEYAQRGIREQDCDPRLDIIRSLGFKEDRFADYGNAIELRTPTNIRIACVKWGSGRCFPGSPG